MHFRFSPLTFGISFILTGCQQPFFQTGQEADLLLGEIGFNQSGGPLLFNHPKGIATDGSVLMMADGNNNRVLLWDNLPTSNSEPTLVFGQQNFDTNHSGESDTELKWPADVAAGGGKYVIADTYNHRILIWNELPTNNASSPDVILTSTKYDNSPDSVPNVEQFAWPWGVWTDGEKLIVTSTSSGSVNGDIRFGGWVLIWNSFPTTLNQPADIVLSANRGMGTPRSITTDGESFLSIGDHNAQGQSSQSGNWLWTTFPTESEQPHDGFLTEEMPFGWMAGDVNSNGDLMMIGDGIHVWDGLPQSGDTQPKYTIDGDDWELRGGDGSTIAITGDTIYVSDYNTNRLIGFNQAPHGPNSTPDFVIGAPDIQTNTLKDNHFISNGIPLSLDSGGLIIGDGMNTRLLCWDEKPQYSGQAPESTVDIHDEVIAMAEHNGTIVVAGKWEGLKVWENRTPCDGTPADKTFRTRVGSIDIGNLQSIAYDQKYFYLLDGSGTLHVWKDIPADEEEPQFSRVLNTFEGILYSDGKHLSISGMDSFKFVKVSKLSENGVLKEIQASDKPQMIGHGIIKDGQVFISDLSRNQVMTWQDLNAAVAGDDPDAILGATNLDDTDPDKTKGGLFWPLRLDFDDERLCVGEYKFSGRVLCYQAE